MFCSSALVCLWRVSILNLLIFQRVRRDYHCGNWSATKAGWDLSSLRVLRGRRTRSGHESGPPAPQSNSRPRLNTVQPEGQMSSEQRSTPEHWQSGEFVPRRRGRVPQMLMSFKSAAQYGNLFVLNTVMICEPEHRQISKLLAQDPCAGS